MLHIYKHVRECRNNKLVFLKDLCAILERESEKQRKHTLEQTYLHGGNAVFLEVYFPHRRAEEHSLLAPIIIMLYFGKNNCPQ